MLNDPVSVVLVQVPQLETAVNPCVHVPMMLAFVAVPSDHAATPDAVPVLTTCAFMTLSDVIVDP